MKIGRILIQALCTIGLLVGVWFCARPLFYDLARGRAEQAFVESYVADTQEIEDEMIAQELEKAYTYNQNLAKLGENSVMHQLTTSEREIYGTVLTKPEQETMGSIEIPALGLVTRILRGTSDPALMAGVGHCDWSSLPIGGESSHCVLSGHSGMDNFRMFDDIDKLKVGDKVILTVLNEKHAYEVIGSKVVLPDEVNSLEIAPGKDLLTLVTCTPYGINTHRLLVFCERCEYVEEVAPLEAATYIFTLSPMRLIPCVLSALAVLLVCFIARRNETFDWSHVLLLVGTAGMFAYGLLFLDAESGSAAFDLSSVRQLVPLMWPTIGCVVLGGMAIKLRSLRRQLSFISS